MHTRNEVLNVALWNCLRLSHTCCECLSLRRLPQYFLEVLISYVALTHALSQSLINLYLLLLRSQIDLLD